MIHSRRSARWRLAGSALAAALLIAAAPAGAGSPLFGDIVATPATIRDFLIQNVCVARRHALGTLGDRKRHSAIQRCENRRDGGWVCRHRAVQRARNAGRRRAAGALVLVDCREWTRIEPPADPAGNRPGFFIDAIRARPDAPAFFAATRLIAEARAAQG